MNSSKDLLSQFIGFILKRVKSLCEYFEMKIFSILLNEKNLLNCPEKHRGREYLEIAIKQT